MFNILGKYKSYSPVVLSFILVTGMILIVVFETFGLARKEVNLSLRMANPIEVAHYHLEKIRPVIPKKTETLNRISSKLNQSTIKVKPSNRHTIENILYDSVSNIIENECQDNSCGLEYKGE